MVSKYSVYLEFRQGSRKKPIIVHEVKAQPYAKVGVGLLHFGEKGDIVAESRKSHGSTAVSWRKVS